MPEEPSDYRFLLQINRIERLRECGLNACRAKTGITARNLPESYKPLRVSELMSTSACCPHGYPQNLWTTFGRCVHSLMHEMPRFVVF
jgi:hypothetical protein